MITQNSKPVTKQKNKKSVSDFHNSCNEKRKEKNYIKKP